MRARSIMIVMNNAETQIMPGAAPAPSLPARSRARRSVALAARTGHEFVYLLGMLCMSIIGFVVWVTGLSLTLSLLVLIVGVLVWLGTAYAFRWTASLDRLLAGWLRGERIPGVYRTPEAGGLFARIRSVTRDPQTWKDFGWLVLNSILGFAFSVAALTATAVVIGYIFMPVWWWAIPHPQTQYGTLNLGIYTVTSTGWAFVTTALGLLLAPLVVLLNRGIANGHAALAALILGPSERQRLSARVQELASTRAGAVQAATEQLERIERDLHDGAQARLVALAMELGMAEEELERNPDAARATVRKARDEALGALGELRDLSRGLRPALLQERGLATAIEALAQRSPLPVTVTASGAIEETPEPVRTAAYFVVAEALTNAVKHGQSTNARVSLERKPDSLEVTVVDDGKGGANPNGSGLTGLSKRVRALDGRLDVISPPGGPTVIRAGIPCA
jgi:signal transduction histidine kinase